MLLLCGNMGRKTEGKMALTFWAKAWLWIKGKWEWVVGLAAALIALLSVLIRSRQQKKVLEAANKAHAKEKEINKKAKDELVEGLAEIAKDKDKKVKDAIDQAEKEEEDLKEEKDEFIDESASSSDLGKKIADHLGAEYVDAKDE